MKQESNKKINPRNLEIHKESNKVSKLKCMIRK